LITPEVERVIDEQIVIAIVGDVVLHPDEVRDGSVSMLEEMSSPVEEAIHHLAKCASQPYDGVG